MERQPKCAAYSWSDHKFRPLDGIGGIVVRLYCRRCGRVIPVTEMFNPMLGAPDLDLPAPDPNEATH